MFPAPVGRITAFGPAPLAGNRAGTRVWCRPCKPQCSGAGCCRQSRRILARQGLMQPARLLRPMRLRKPYNGRTDGCLIIGFTPEAQDI